jgi:cytochrome c-type biogenesis protein CcmF
MSAQLVIFMLFFLVVPVIILIANRKSIHIPKEEDQFSSREFWMFIGTLVLVIGCLQITFTTSTPVFNKLFGTKIAPPADAIDHFNRWQVPVAILISLLIGVGQFFRYKQTDWQTFFRKISLPLAASIVVTAVCAIFIGAYRPHYYLLLFASIFAVLANLDYILRSLNGNLRNAGASIAHIGIGMILCGALISNSMKQVISRNVKNIDLGSEMPNGENILIENKNDTLPMGEYLVSYTGKERKGVNVFYSITYFKHDPVTGNKVKQFELKPFVQLNERMGNVAEPATKHFFTKDIYTHITYAEIEKEADKKDDDYLPEKTQELAPGDTFITSNSFVILEGLNRNINREELHLKDSDLAVGAKLRIQDINRKNYEAEPVFMIKDFEIYSAPATVDELGLYFDFHKIDPSTGKITLAVREKKNNKRDFVIMKAIIFPGINILWSGCLLMIIGTLMSVRKRILANRRTKHQP